MRVNVNSQSKTPNTSVPDRCLRSFDREFDFDSQEWGFSKSSSTRASQSQIHGQNHRVLLPKTLTYGDFDCGLPLIHTTGVALMGCISVVLSRWHGNRPTFRDLPPPARPLAETIVLFRSDPRCGLRYMLPRLADGILTSLPILGHVVVFIERPGRATQAPAR